MLLHDPPRELFVVDGQGYTVPVPSWRDNEHAVIQITRGRFVRFSAPNTVRPVSALKARWLRRTGWRVATATRVPKVSLTLLPHLNNDEPLSREFWATTAPSINECFELTSDLRRRVDLVLLPVGAQDFEEAQDYLAHGLHRVDEGRPLTVAFSATRAGWRGDEIRFDFHPETLELTSICVITGTTPAA